MASKQKKLTLSEFRTTAKNRRFGAMKAEFEKDTLVKRLAYSVENVQVLYRDMAESWLSDIEFRVFDQTSRFPWEYGSPAPFGSWQINPLEDFLNQFFAWKYEQL
jgi:hypothetical protein